MLHNCLSCGEAWSAEYILAHMDRFQFHPDDNRCAITECPHCRAELPGVPGETMRRRLERVRIVRISDELFLVHDANGNSYRGTLRAALEVAICAN